MATKNPLTKLREASKDSGKRFGQDKPIQRNKESTGDKPNRSPGESNANRLGPSVNEDLSKSANRDIDRINKAVSQRFDNRDEEEMSSQEKFGRKQTKTAGIRAGSRSVGRLGYLGAASLGGQILGEEVIAPRHLKNYEKYLADNGVKLSEESKRRIKEEEDFQSVQRALRAVDQEREDEKKMRKGGAVAKKMAMGGAVQQAKVGKVMKEFKAGSLHSGKGGKVVKSPKQAIAIALSEAQRMKKK